MTHDLAVRFLCDELLLVRLCWVSFRLHVLRPRVIVPQHFEVPSLAPMLPWYRDDLEVLGPLGPHDLQAKPHLISHSPHGSEAITRKLPETSCKINKEMWGEGVGKGGLVFWSGPR